MAQAVVDLDPVERRPELIVGKPSFNEITEAVAQPVEWTPPIGWYITLGISLSLLALFGVSIGWLFWEGIGIWGNNIPVAWGWPIVNFVFWVGIGHAGTLISAVLFLFRQKWRTSINRAAEAMTIFAVICALIFPGIHTGRPWVAAYWMLPIPNQMDMWPQFRSPLMWDVFAVSIYFTVSLLFWYLGLIPDLATMRDRAKDRIRRMTFGFFALGWRGSQRNWLHYEKAYLLLAGLATPLVLSVHSVVSFDFATSQLPGWHTTIFPPYFVAGAIFSGMAMVMTLMLICRVVFKMEHIINMLHFDRMAKLILLTGTIVGYAYGIEFFVAWYSGNAFERFAFLNRAFGPYAWAYWIMVSCNVLSPQVFWFKKARSSIAILFVVSILVNIGMWFERFVIVVTSLHRDFLPANWDYFSPTFLGYRDFRRKFRAVLHPLHALRSVLAHGGHRRGEGRSAASSRPCPGRARRGRGEGHGRSRSRKGQRRLAQTRLRPAGGILGSDGAHEGRRQGSKGRLQLLGRPLSLPDPRLGEGHGAAAIHGSGDGPGHGPWRRGRRHGAAMVGQHAGLPAGGFRQAFLQLAGLHSDHVRVWCLGRRPGRHPRIHALFTTAAPSPPSVRIRAIREVQ